MEGKNFKIISADSGQDLVPLVNKEMEKGWIPTGMYSTNFNYNYKVHQGMMKPITLGDPVRVVEDTENPSGGRRKRTRRNIRK